MLTVETLEKYYNRGKPNELHALRGVSFSVREVESVAIMGKSGAGKSTLLHLLGCIDSCDGGSIDMDGVRLDQLNSGKKAAMRNQKIGLVLQNFALIPDYTALENVLIPFAFRKGGTRRYKKHAMQVLETLGIGELAKKNASQLSGGQKQRVAIARAIAADPAYILADEPTGALDTQTAQEIMTLLFSLQEKGKTLILVTHDASVASRCDRTLVLEDGRLA